MTIVSGDRFKHKLDGGLYKVKVIRKGSPLLEFFVLESENSPNRIWVGEEEDVEVFFERID